MSAMNTTIPRFDELPSRLRDETLAPMFDGVIDTEAQVHCPWCGSVATIALDPGSGPDQRYAEDCPVCCREWAVSVRYGAEGAASVGLAR